MSDTIADLYDRLAETYEAGRHLFDTGPQLRAFAAHLPGPSHILDAGCGGGRPAAEFFVGQGHAVTGIDLSPRMLELARRNVPQGTYLAMDMTAIDFPAASFDGVVAIYSLFHVPRDRHGDVFGHFRRVLRPGGVVLMTLATRDYTGQDVFDGEKEFLGERLPYSHDTPAMAREKLEAAGFEVVSGESVNTGGETFDWVIAKAVE